MDTSHTSAQQNDSSSPARSKRKLIITILFVLLVAAVAYLFWQNYQLRSPDYQSKLQAQVNDKLVQEVSSIVLLPEDEEPTIASITNADELRSANQEFYQDAQNGDKILFYSSRAIIYRESEGKIINLAPVTIDAGDQQGLEQDSPDQQ